MDEEKILSLVQNGESDAYRALVERYQAGVIIYCDQIVYDRDAAEDIAQEAFVKAYYSLGQFDTKKAAFSTWLYRIAANQAKDYLRKHRKKVALEDIEQAIHEVPDISEAEANEIQSAVRELQPPEYARVVQAYFWEGLRYEQIAAELQVPVGTIGTWLKRAKAQLRKELS